MIAAWLLCAALGADPVAELARREAAAAAAPESIAAQHSLGVLLAETYVSPDAIPVLRRALALGLAGPPADHARLWIVYLLIESGQDQAAVAECRALLAAWPPGHPPRESAQGLLESIATRHAALADVTSSETRAIIAVVLAALAMAGGFVAGRRLGGHHR